MEMRFSIFPSIPAYFGNSTINCKKREAVFCCQGVVVWLLVERVKGNWDPAAAKNAEAVPEGVPRSGKAGAERRRQRLRKNVAFVLVTKQPIDTRYSEGAAKKSFPRILVQFLLDLFAQSHVQMFEARPFGQILPESIRWMFSFVPRSHEAYGWAK